MRTGTNRKRTPAQPAGHDLSADNLELTVEWESAADGSDVSCSLINVVSGWIETKSDLDTAETLTFDSVGVVGQTYVARLQAFLEGESSKVSTTDPVTL